MKAVLFDIDNTLLMKRPGIPEKWREILKARDIQISLTDAQRAFAK